MPGRSRHRSLIFRFTRSALLGTVLLSSYFAAASSAYYARQRSLNRAQSHLPLPAVPAPTSATRLLVFAPHCDDETLGNAGLIQQTLAAGGAVRVIILTNGDAFPAAAERQFRNLHLQPADYLRFAALRQQESLSALGSLGVKAENVAFCGYPDRGLMPLWNDYWTPNRLYTSPTTRCQAVPYPVAAQPDAPYCGAQILNDIKAAIAAFRPTLITVTHPAEDHADHAAASAFVALAFAELQADPQQASWARQARLSYYLIHRGDWPVASPNRGATLAPPAAMANLDTRWRARPLTADETARKARSIALYPSQMAMMQPFLSSFVCANEIYGEQRNAVLAKVPDGTFRADSSTGRWDAQEPALLSPLADNVLRDRLGGGDIRAVYACRDSQRLYLRLDMRQNIRGRFTYLVRLRGIGPQGQSQGRTLTLRLSPYRSTDQNEIQTTAHGKTLEAAVPWALLAYGSSPLQILALSVDTSMAGISIDQTGIRLLHL